MSIRSKFWIGLGFLFLITAVVVVLSLLSVRRLTETGTKVIRDNYRSLEYMQAIDSLGDAGWAILQKDRLQPCLEFQQWRRKLENQFQQQRQNVTEPSERQATLQLGNAIARLPDCGGTPAIILPILEEIHIRTDRIASLNLKAIRTKSEAAEIRGSKAMQEAVVVATMVFLVVLMFAASFPRTILLPLSELTRMARRLAGGAYGEQVPIDNDKNEIGQLALAFNNMSSELYRYQRSSVAQLMEVQQRTEHIINRLHSPLIVADGDWRILFFNNLARQVLGTQSAPLIGGNLLELAVRNDLLRSWLVPVTEGKKQPAEPFAVVIGRRQHYFLTEAFPIADSSSGPTLGYVLSMTDVTRFRELDQAKTDFLATIAHELKTPLSTLNISLNILKGGRAGQITSDQSELMGTMTEELNRLMTLINGLLDLSRLETHTEGQNSQAHQLDIQQLLKETVTRFQVLADEKKVNFRIDSQLGVVSLPIETNSLSLAVGNLVSNAVRFSPQGGTINIIAPKEEGRISISIEDEGPGIPAEDQGRVFDKYYHGSGDGTGLGLFIARGVVEKAAGTVQFEARETGGSRFTISFPVTA